MPGQSRKFLKPLILTLSGIAMLFIFIQVDSASGEFAQNIPGAKRPILDVLQWLVIVFVIYIGAWALVGGLNRKSEWDVRANGWWNIAIIVIFGIAFRFALVGSVPIQEIDLYRYIWDGAVVASGNDPYVYAPKTILTAYQDRALAKERPELQKLCSLIDDRPGLKGVLEIVHFGEFTSPYPPVSQICFAIAVSSCGVDATPLDYVIATKWMLIVFDMATGFLVVLMLYQVRLPIELSVAYWWCPLVIKEIANSGHLDSIATFFVALAVYFSVASTVSYGFRRRSSEERDSTSMCKSLPAFASAISLALSVAAKVFPVILVPLWLVFFARRSLLTASLALMLFAATTVLATWPMAKHLTPVKKLAPQSADSYDEAPEDRSGIEAFSKYWEMNDLIFMSVVENLKPAGSSFSPNGETEKTATTVNELSDAPWFRITSESFRWKFCSGFATSLQILKSSPALMNLKTNEAVSDEQLSPQNYAFFATRLLTGVLFALIAVWCCWRIWTDNSPIKFLEMVFLTIAWFWLLAPTQNPWYWIWAMPFLVFAKSRFWFLMSGVLFVYYLRFWFDYHYRSTIVGVALSETFPSGIFNWIFPGSENSSFAGKTFYDFYLPWYEFGPLLLLLASGWVVHMIRNRAAGCSE